MLNLMGSLETGVQCMAERSEPHQRPGRMIRRYIARGNHNVHDQSLREL
jgi:hypothetical protein